MKIIRCKQEECGGRDQKAKTAALEITLNWLIKTTVTTPFGASTMSQICSENGTGERHPAATILTQSQWPSSSYL